MMNLAQHMYLFLSQAADEPTGNTWLQTIHSGGPVGYLIIGLSLIAAALVVMHVMQIRRVALMPPHQLEQLHEAMERGDVATALEFCLNPENDSYLTRIIAPGLTRFQKSAFGAFEIKSAIEESGEDQTARLYRSTDALGVIGAIAPLLGLLGTVLGMVGAFEAISQSSASNHEALATSISLALVTTLMGLTLAIPCMALFTFFRNRIDAFASEAGMEIERLVLHLESGSTSGPASPEPRPPQARVQPVSPAASSPTGPTGE